MRVGVALPSSIPGTDAPTVLEWARQAEALGFSHLAAIDRIVYGNWDPLLTLAAAAAVTTRIAVATTVLISPLRNTELLQKELATLDQLSGGRLVLGVGIGARSDDYQVLELDTSRRGRVLAEQVGDLRGEGAGAALQPPMVQRDGPVILMGGGSGAAFARLARLADGYIHGGGPPRVFARMADQARTAWIDADRPGAPRLWGQGYFALSDEGRGRQYIRDYYAFTGPFADRLAAGILTTPAALLDYVRAYEEAGCDELSLLPTVGEIGELERLAEALETYLTQ
jgi:hypothetical protein